MLYCYTPIIYDNGFHNDITCIFIGIRFPITVDLGSLEAASCGPQQKQYVFFLLSHLCSSHFPRMSSSYPCSPTSTAQWPFLLSHVFYSDPTSLLGLLMRMGKFSLFFFLTC